MNPLILIIIFLVFVSFFLIYILNNKISDLKLQLKNIKPSSSVASSITSTTEIDTKIEDSITSLRGEFSSLVDSVSADGGSTDVYKHFGVSASSELGYEIDNTTNEIIFNMPVRFKNDIETEGTLEVSKELYVGPDETNRAKIYINDDNDIVYGKNDGDNLGFMISQDNIPSIKSNDKPIQFFVNGVNTINSADDKFELKTKLEIKSPTIIGSNISNTLVYDIDNITGTATDHETVYERDQAAAAAEVRRLARVDASQLQYNNCVDSRCKVVCTVRDLGGYCMSEAECRSKYMWHKCAAACDRSSQCN